MTSQGIVERVARALYEHWVGEQIDAEYAPWEKLGDKTSWRERAQAAIEAAGIEALTKRVGVYQKALERIEAHYTDTGLAPKHMAAIARAALNTVREEEK